MEKLKAVVLAAGKGTRMMEDGADMPKVLRPALGRPLLGYVLDALSFIDNSDTVIVVGYMKEKIISAFPGYVFAEQREQLGTGHAAASAVTALEGFGGAVLVCCGDMPLIKKETYEGLVKHHFEQGNDCTILTGASRYPLSYGRIVRDKNGGYAGIVEEKDATPEQLAITELNSGVYVFGSVALFEALSELKSDNAQNEYYLTDVPSISPPQRARPRPGG